MKKILSIIAILLLPLSTYTYSETVPAVEILKLVSAEKLDPKHFITRAEFAIDDDVKSLSSVFATIEEHPAHGTEHLWLEINFFPFVLTKDEIESATTGNFAPIENRWHSEDGLVKTEIYNSRATVVLSMDTQYKVWQVDMAMPGHSCTIAWKEEDLEKFLREYDFEDGNIRLKSKGSYTCNSMSDKQPEWTHKWDFNINVPVFKKTPHS
jgi:hypothetical protein